VARSIAWLFNPVLYSDDGRHLAISHEEIGLLSGVSRPVAGQSLKRLEREGLIRMEHGGLTIVELERLRIYGD
jgi:CRP-like cAMP-binding protein